MVPKHILMNSTAKSSIRRLVTYITDPQDKVSRIERICVHNCISEDAQDAALEMEATQLLNKRSRLDKTYHLMLSFPSGEEPTVEELENIELEMCFALGYADHQRVSVVHHDTDNLHLHLAINKIHPKKLTIHEPRRDFQILAKAAERIEKTHQLIPTNHTPKKTMSENRVGDIQRMSGQETFVSQIRANCLEALLSAKSWDDIHSICAQHDVSLQLRGNGLIFAQTLNEGGVIVVKANTIARELSKEKLVARLGAFLASAHDVPQGKAVASSKMAAENTGSPLWRRYVAARQEWQEKSIIEKARLQEERSLKRQLIEALYNIERKTSRQSSLPYWQRQYRLLKLKDEMATRRGLLTNKNRVAGYLEWLQQQVMSGDLDALAALRKRADAMAKSGNKILAKDYMPSLENDFTVDTVTKQGTVIYAIGGDIIIRERGDTFYVPTESGVEALAITMKMAVRHSRNRLTVTRG